MTPTVRAVIDRCLLKDPEARYQKADEVRSALEAARDGGALAAACSVVADGKAASDRTGPSLASAVARRCAMAIVIVVAGISLERRRTS